MERQERDRFRAAWFGAYRSVNFFIRQVDEFETYALEDRFIGNPFRIGAVRLTVSHERKQALRRLRGQIMTTASRLGDDMDDLSYYLLPEDQGRISDILGLLSTVERLPESYGELIVLGRQVAELYREFLESIGEREGFKRAS
jgi:hypothetical protein